VGGAREIFPATARSRMPPASPGARRADSTGRREGGETTTGPHSVGLAHVLPHDAGAMMTRSMILAGLLFLLGCDSSETDSPTEADLFVGVWEGSGILSAYAGEMGYLYEKRTGTVTVIGRGAMTVAVDFTDLEPGACLLT
jgi:hypothetical protein